MQILWHSIAIITFIIIETAVIFTFGTNAKLLDFVLYYLFDLSFFFISALWLLPLTCKKVKTISKRILFILIWITLATFLNKVLTEILYLLHKVELSKDHKFIFLLKAFTRQLYLFSLSLGYWYARKSIKQEEETKIREVAHAKEKEENARLELALTRSQMDPHLMVNALSSVQGILMEKSPEAVKIIYSLTEIHTNILEMSSPIFNNTLSNELCVMHEVITLFKELGKESFHLEESIEQHLMELPFPPHAIIGIVENVFKHADFNTLTAPPLISIRGKGDLLNILVKNKVQSGNKKNNRQGLGLQNIRKSLDSAYPGKYEWKESTEQGSYELSITIKLYEKI